MEKNAPKETETLSLTDKDTNESETQKIQYVVEKQSRSAFVGPLPPPEILAKYENTFPGAAERIFQMAEDQALHRRSMEKESLKLAGRDSLLEIITSFIIASAGIAGGIFIVYLNPSSAANALLS